MSILSQGSTLGEGESFEVSCHLRVIIRVGEECDGIGAEGSRLTLRNGGMKLSWRNSRDAILDFCKLRSSPGGS